MMVTTPDGVISRIREARWHASIQVAERSPTRIFIEVDPDDIPDISRLLFKDLKARFQTASGIDTPAAIEVLYHWAFDSFSCVVTVRTRLNREQPQIESIAPICVGAEWIEREMWELLGITFNNHPDMRHLLLADDWPKDRYPLRRDYQN